MNKAHTLYSDSLCITPFGSKQKSKQYLTGDHNQGVSLKMRLKHFALALAACAALAMMPSTTRADNLSLVIQPSYIGQSGGSVTLTGTFTNGAGAILWDGYALNSSPVGLTDAAVQPINYFVGGLASGAVLGPTSIFTIDISAAVANGTLFPLAGNSLTVFYTGSNGQAGQVDVNFEITIRNDQPPPGIPEPATMVLLGSGLAGLAALKRRRRGPQIK
jgi:hypothetical protein